MILVEIVLAPILKPKKGSGIVRYNCFTKITVAVYEANELRNILEGFVKELHSEDTICTVILDIKLMIS